MARAKRTDRAEARRRYRAATATESMDDPIEGEAEAPSRSGGASSATSAASTGRPPGTPARMSMASAFKASFRPMHVREDVLALPWIAVHTKALWLPVLITLASTVLVTVTGGNDVLSAFLYQYFILTPAIGGVFIAGFLAPRASWLLGIIVGLVAAVCYSFLGLSGVVPVSPTVSSTDVVVTSFVLSPIIGSFFAASAAWYRRFLTLSNPNRARQSKAAAPKKGDGRTRSGGSQKAGVRR